MSEQAVFEALQLRLEVDNAGTRRYYNSAGQLHRLHGPAVEFLSGERWWYQNGKLHRTDGPAIMSKTGIPSFWLNGEYMTPNEYDRAVGYVKWLART